MGWKINNGALIEQEERIAHNHCGSCIMTHFLTADHTCQICPISFACNGSSQQMRCQPGYFADGGETECHECGGDDKHSREGAEQCSTCHLGSYTSGGTKRTRTKCTVCPPGYMCTGLSTQTMCGGGYFSPGGQDFCHPCGANNKYSVAGSAECSICGAGHYTTGGTNQTRTACRPTKAMRKW